MKFLARLFSFRKSSRKAPHQIIGEWGEREAARYLKRSGFSIIERNWRIRLGELDIIARKDREIIFVEVKTNSALSDIGPERRVGIQKQKKIRTLARAYLQRKHSESADVRFDVIAVWREGKKTKLQHFENAF